MRAGGERLKQLHIRFYPPALTLEVEVNGRKTERQIPLEIDESTVPSELAEELIRDNPCFKPTYKDRLTQSIENIMKMQGVEFNTYEVAHTHKAHEMPLTDCSFNKMGDLFVTASNDRTCRIWETSTGRELHSLANHTNAVYCCTFNDPLGTLIATGSSDKTAMLWKVDGTLAATLTGHTRDVVKVRFDHRSIKLATASLDATARLYDVQTGKEHVLLKGHRKEVTQLAFSTEDDLLMTGSFDATVKLWDVRTGNEVATLAGHKGEISSAKFDWPGERVLSSSFDATARLWDTRMFQTLVTMAGHTGAVMDASFSPDGNWIATSSADQTARIWDAEGEEQFVCEGHTAEVSRVMFSPQCTRLLTASDDGTCRLWDVMTGLGVETLKAHTGHIMSCSFNYTGEWIITASHDNTVIQWKATRKDFRY
jgi:dynein assembly factor with WDR repeat domains 1